MIGGAPLWGLAMLGYNPFLKIHPQGWAREYENDSKDKKSFRRSPFKVPLWAWALGYVIAAGCLVVPAYHLHRNGGLYDGWAVTPIPLAFICLTIAFSNLHWPLYFASCVCTNINFIQVMGIIASVIAFITILDFTTLYAFFAIPYIVWNMFWWMKVYMEDLHRCGWATPKKKCDDENVLSYKASA